jgi:hypothetical protein
MESSLHRELKGRYAGPAAGSVEFRQGPFVADAIGPDGAWVEIQSSPLGALGGKLGRLLEAGRVVRVVKPVVLTHRIVRPNRPGDGRLSPRRGDLIEVFDELVNLMRYFPHDRLSIEVVGVHIAEVREHRRRRPGYVVTDRCLRGFGPSVVLRGGQDLWGLLPADGCNLPEPFTTLDLDRHLGRGQPFAQRVAYCLRQSGAVTSGNCLQRRRQYRRVEPPAPLPAEGARPTMRRVVGLDRALARSGVSTEGLLP